MSGRFTSPIHNSRPPASPLSTKSPAVANSSLRLSLLESFDTGNTLDDFDPSTGDGHRAIYDREVPFHIRTSVNDNGTPEPTRVKILIMGEEQTPESCRVEVTTETDLFFHYSHTITRSTFKTVRTEQKLKVEFNEYPSVLIRMFNNCIREPNLFISLMTLHEGGFARLDFLQNMVYKQLDLLAVDFVCSSEEVVRQQIHFRYNSLKGHLQVVQSQLNELISMLKIKNPSLVKLIQKQNPTTLHDQKFK